ncbi:MAG: M4 family metallopeptidase [Chloroflexota bacterium]
MRAPRRTLTTLALFALVAANAAPPPALAARPAPRHGPLPAGVKAVRNPSLDRLTWLSGDGAHPVVSAAALGHPATALGAASGFVAHLAMPAFGVADPVRSLRVTGIAPDALGNTFVRYRQTYRGLPVVAGELVIQVGPRRDIVSVNGRTAPSLSLDTRPRVSAARARRLAILATAKQENVPASALRAGGATLSVYDPALAGDPRRPAGAHLAWRIDVTGARGSIDEFTAIDARTGALLGAFNQVETAIPAHAKQRICDIQGARQSEPGDSPTTSDALQCDPGDPTQLANPVGSGITDAVIAFKGAEATYQFYAKRFGRNSLDGKGMTLISTVRFCPYSTFYTCPWANAWWNGVQMEYGVGWASADDVVAHELTHGVTSFSSRLLYWFQSGAINESLSDIFGEMVDQTNGLGTDTSAVRWQMGEDSPLGAIRSMADPTTSLQGASPDRMQSPNYKRDPSLTDRGGVHYNSGVGNKAAYLMTQGGTFNNQTVTGLGIDKSAAIWYRTATRYLTAGSDYNDLATALRQACKDLIGTRPLNKAGKPSAGGAITAANCVQVGNAITATEMTLEPLVLSAVHHTTLCPTGQTPTAGPLNDKITSTGAGWTIQGTPNVWSVATWFASSKPYAWAASDRLASSDASIRSKAIAIPAKGTTYLAFRHYTNFQDWASPYEGGVVEYALAPSGPWASLGSQFVFGGYNGVILSGVGNALQGQPAFMGMNYGMANAKVDLSFLHGQTVYIRFRMATNNDTTAFDGWVIDDVRVYQCA